MLTQFYNFRDLLEAYPSQTPASAMETMIDKVMTVYQNGDTWYKQHIKLLCRTEYQENMAFLNSLKELSARMCTEETNSLVLGNDHLRLNLNPFLSFMKEHELRDLMLQIRAINGNLLLFITSDTIMDVRDSIMILNRWEYAFTEMIMKDE